MFTTTQSSRFARTIARRIASVATILAAAAALASPAHAQTTNALFVSLGGTGSAGFANGVQGISSFSTPHAVAAPGDGFLYIADFGNNAIRKLNLVDRVVSTFAVTSISRPVGVVFDSEKNLYVANQGSGRITKYSSTGTYLTSINSPATGGSISALAIDEIDYLYVAHLNGFHTDTYVGGAGSEFRGVAVGGDGAVYASDAARHVIWKFTSQSNPEVYAGTLNTAGEAITGFTTGQFNRPHNIAFAPNGALVVADRGNHQLRAVDCDGAITVLVGIDPDLWFVADSPDVFPGWWDSSPQFAELRDPIGVTVDTLGNVFDTEAYYHLVRGGLNVRFPACGEDPGSGVPGAISVQISPNQGFFEDAVTVVVSPAVGSTFGDGVQIYYSIDGTTPTQASNRAPIQDGLARIELQGPIDLSSLRVRAYNNGVAGPVAQGQPIDIPLPGLNPPSGFFLTNVVITVTNVNSETGLFPAGARIFYTIDGSQPNQSSPEATITGGIGRITLTGPINLEELRVRAFVGNTGGATVQGGSTSDIPNIISFGFEAPQEASSDFVASPGQRFYAPVTLTIRPGQLMYGLQFGLNVTNLTGPAPANYTPGFESMLVKPVPPSGAFAVIPPATLANRTVSVDPVIVSNNIIWVTNVYLDFENLVVTNSSNNLLMVGWLERYQATNLYNTLEHDLIRYSLPHDRLFVSQQGNQVVAGGYSFVVPATAAVGQTYQIEISRPSGNADGIREDVVIETPLDPNGPLRARQTVTVGDRRYIVGDLAPFRWFNAGDFGDGSIVNNDMEQIHQSVIYGVNNPPPGSDMEGAIDSCCVDTNGVNLAGSFQPWNGNDDTINTIGFGDGELDISDLYVSFRRALDPSLVWYERYWSAGELRANPIPNTFRGEISGFSASSFRNTATKGESVMGAASTVEPSVHFSVGAVLGNPGQTVEVPIYAQVKGPHPIKTLLLNLSVKTIDGRANLTENVSFWAHPLLGAPTLGGTGTTTGYGGAWIDPNHSGLYGNVQVGTLLVAIPANATASSAFLVSIEKVSASPNGVAKLPVTKSNAAIIMANRPNVGWNDGIPDQWRIQYFGTLADLKAAGDFDADGDGVSNGGEFQLGSNPTNPGDHLKVAGSILPNHTMKFRFPTAAGYKYQLLVSTNLTDWNIVQENILGTGSEIELTSNSEAPLGYYRIQVQQD
jgi:sugar lactone lactonase YvrE